MDIREKFFLGLLEDINSKKLILPTLPEVAIRVRKIVEDARASASAIAKVVSTDAALSARLMQVANSAYYRGQARVEGVQAAVARLGNNAVRNLVTGFALRQIYQVKCSASIRRRLQALQEHNILVAAYSHVLARRFTPLKPDVALLGGLIQRIGALPILIRAESMPELLNDPQALDSVIDQTHKMLGRAILEAWNFPPSLVAVVVEHEDLQRDPAPQADYVDVVLVAVLHSYLGTEHPLSRVNWDEVPAFSKLGLSPRQHIEAMKEARDEVLDVQKLLSV